MEWSRSEAAFTVHANINII